MAKTKITIVGLGHVGTAIGLALAGETRNYEIIGHDKDPKAAGAARKSKAVDSTEWNLITACEGASIIVLALPVLAIRETMLAVAPYLQEGALLTDTASLKEPVLQWADETLPDHVDFVGGDPVIGSMDSHSEEPTAETLKGALYCLCPSPRAKPEAVRLTAGLVERLGAKAYFVDAAEHDGLMAAVDHLPMVLAASLLHSTTGSSGWRDMRRLAGGQYESGTRFASDTPAIFRDACLHNRQHVLHWLDAFIEDLLGWKALISEGDSERLERAYDEAMKARQEWLRLKASGLWDLEDAPQAERAPGYLQSLFGLGRRAEPRGKSR